MPLVPKGAISELTSVRVMAKMAAIALLMLAVWLGFKARNEAREYEYIGVPLTEHVITVSGEGRTVGIPDVAILQLGMTVERKEVSDAQAENTRVMNALIEEVRSSGVAEVDIQTTSYNVSPAYDWDDGKRNLRGYTVAQNVRVKVRDLESVGRILGAAGELGANQIGGVTFEVDDPEALKQEARILALENAKEKAEALAKVAEVDLGRVVSFQESFGGGIPEPIFYERALSIGGVADAAAPSLEAGSDEIVSNVTITYLIR